MNIIETGKLLTVISGFDRFVVVDQVTATAWQLALADIAYEDAEQAVVAHFTSGSKAITVADVREIVGMSTRRTPRLIAEDVRAARARGLINRDWPENRPLPDGTLAALTAARAADRGVSPTETLTAGASIDYGLTLKTPGAA